MAVYRKLPVEIEAFQWFGGSDPVTEPEWMVDAIKVGLVVVWPSAISIKTLEGPIIASPGDWIIKGVEGELYPCKPGIFEQTYELVTSARKPMDMMDRVG